MEGDSGVIYQGQHIQVVVPDRSIASDSLRVEVRDGISNYVEWTSDHDVETYHAIRAIFSMWKDEGIATGMMVAGREVPGGKFAWEVIPFSKEGWPFWRRLLVLCRMYFGGRSLSSVERERLATVYRKQSDQFSQKMEVTTTKTAQVAQDAFCRPAVIAKQSVLEGHEVRVLYNYAPMGVDDAKNHFMVVPKDHREGFDDLALSEFLETSAKTRDLVNHFKGKGYPMAYIFNKTGQEAGQTVAHFHQHVIFVDTPKNDFWGKVQVFTGTALGSALGSARRLDDATLKRKVEGYIQDFKLLMTVDNITGATSINQR